MDINSFFFPTHLLIPCLISLFLLLLILSTGKSIFKQRKYLWASLIIFFCVYIFILVYSNYLSNHYRWELQAFDLDGNGSFSVDERTPEQQKAQLKVIGDNGRNLSYITGFILAFIISLAVYFSSLLYRFIKFKKI